jgi:hypothetical protein
MGLQPADSAGRRPKQCNILFAVTRRWLVERYNVFGNLFVEPKDISTVSVRDLCLYIKGTGLLN